MKYIGPIKATISKEDNSKINSFIEREFIRNKMISPFYLITS